MVHSGSAAHACMQGKEVVKGKPWFPDEDRKHATVLRPDKSGKAITTILRHLNRIQEVRCKASPDSRLKLALNGSSKATVCIAR